MGSTVSSRHLNQYPPYPTGKQHSIRFNVLGCLCVNSACRFLSMLVTSTVLYNIVDSPVGSIPVTRVDPKLDALTEEWTVRGEGKGQGSSQVEARLYGKGGIYDVEAMAGLPVGVQIAGKSWEEEKVIEMMKVVDRALGERGFGPGSYRKWKEGRSS
jgi:hypothetical protein